MSPITEPLPDLDHWIKDWKYHEGFDGFSDWNENLIWLDELIPWT